MRTFLMQIVGLAALLVAGSAPAVAEDSSTVATAVEQRVRHATVTNFESEAQLGALAAKGKTVVFFFASWCPNCRATVTELNARWAEVNPDLILVIADYDKETALKSKYGVTYQDTFVLLDAKSDGVKSWNSGGVNGLNANTAQ